MDSPSQPPPPPSDGSFERLVRLLPWCAASALLALLSFKVDAPLLTAAIARCSTYMLGWCGINAECHANVVDHPGGHFDVTSECLFVPGCFVLAPWVLRRFWQSHTLLRAVLLSLAVLGILQCANFLRIVMLMCIPVDPLYRWVWCDKVSYGILFVGLFLIALPSHKRGKTTPNQADSAAATAAQ